MRQEQPASAAEIWVQIGLHHLRCVTLSLAPKRDVRLNDVKGEGLVFKPSLREELFASQLWGSQVRGTSGDFRGRAGKFRGTSGLLLKSTVRAVPGKWPGNFR